MADCIVGEIYKWKNSSTGYIKIVAQSVPLIHKRKHPWQEDWELQAREWDVIKQEKVGGYFNLTHAELQE